MTRPKIGTLSRLRWPWPSSNTLPPSYAPRLDAAPAPDPARARGLTAVELIAMARAARAAAQRHIP